MSYLLKNTKLLYTLLLLLMLIDRFNNYLRFSIVYTDSDQILLWQVAKDMMSGIFHGPCFYGQSFNPNFEPLLALPFLFFGMDFYSALPLATNLLSIAPFLILSFYFYKKFNPLFGMLPLILSLLLPPEYSMLTSISRGFVAGIFFAIIGMALFAFHKSSYSKFIGGISLGIGIYANPNCVLLFPLLIPYLAFEREKLFILLKPLIFGLILGLSTLGFNALYYSFHKGIVFLGQPQLDISFTYFFSVISRLDSYFDIVTPLIWRFGWISLLFFVIIGIRLWRNNRKLEFYTVLIIFVLILFSFSVHKISDGTNSVFFSGSRMFMAYPFIVMFIFIYFIQTFNDYLKNKVFLFLIVLAFLSFSIKLFAFDFFLKNALKGSKNSIVSVVTVNKLRTTCKDILKFSGDNVDLIIANSPDTPDQPITYGCPCMLQNFPVTVQPLYERRSWLMPGIMETVYKRILIHGKDTARWNKMNLDGLNIIRMNKQNGWLLIENNLYTRDLLNKIGISPL